MEKRGVKLVVVSMLIVALFLLVLSAGIVFAEEEVERTEEESAYQVGRNLESFAELSAEKKIRIIKHLDAFLEGVEESGGEDKFAELWFEQDDDKKFIFDDELKNEIWNNFKQEDREKYLRKFIEKKFKESGNVELKEIGFEDKIKILDDENKLVWVGNKMGVLNERGRLNSWIDLDDLPRWVRGVTFENGEFDLEFDTGNGNIHTKFNGGTIGSTFGELIGPDGKRIGTRMDNGLKSIKYDNENKQFVVTFNLDGGEDRVLHLAETDVPLDYREYVKKALSNGKAKDVLENLDDYGIDFLAGTEGDLKTQNMISVLYGGSYDNEGVVEINYDEKGRPVIKTTGGADLVSIDSRGMIERYYKQWYSKDSLTNSDADSSEFVKKYNRGKGKDSQISDEAAVFSFGSNGEIESAQNAQVSVPGFATAYTARNEMTGVHIVRNTFADAIIRGDNKRIVEAVLAKGSGILEEFGISSFSIKDGLRVARETNIRDVEQKLMKILQDELNNPDLAIEVKAQINEAINTISYHLESKTSNVIDSFMISDGQGQLSESQRNFRNSLMDGMEREIEGAVSHLLQDPDALKELAKYAYGGAEFGNPDKANEVIQSLLKEKLNRETMDKFVDGINFGTGFDNYLKNKLKDQFPTSAEITGFIDGLKISEVIGQGLKSDSSSASIQDMIFENVPSIKKEDAGFLAGFINIMQKKIDVEGRKALDEIKADLKPAEYKNNIIMDTYLNEIYVEGDEEMVVNVDNPLEKFSAKSLSAEGSIALFSRGQRVASFSGENINVPTRGFRSGTSINRIINENSGNTLKFAQTFPGSYELYDPSRQVVKSSSVLSVGWLRAHALFSTEVNGPLEGDIADSAESNVVMTIGGRRPGLLMRLGVWLMGGVPISPGGDAMRNVLNEVTSRIKNGVYAEGYNQGLEGSGSFINWAKDSGAEIPSVITDTHYVAGHVDELYQFSDFIGSASNLQLGDKLVFTNSYIEMSGRRLQMSPEMHRTILRAVADNPINKRLGFIQAYKLYKNKNFESLL